jgi:hypothetical protein
MRKASIRCCECPHSLWRYHHRDVGCMYVIGRDDDGMDVFCACERGFAALDIRMGTVYHPPMPAPRRKVKRK